MTEVKESSEHQDETENTELNRDFALPLRQAREKAGLTVEEVAEQLLLPVDIIKSIEKSDVDDLPSSTFVIGYIRSYAKILELSSDEIINAYTALSPARNSVITPSPFAEAETVKPRKSRSVYIILIAVLALLAAWIYINKVDNLSDQSATGSTNQFFNTASETVESDVKKTSESGVPDEFKSGNQESPADSSETVVTQDDGAKPVVDVEDTTLPALSDSLGEMSRISDELILTAIGESWAEVIDAQGDRLFYQLINDGEEIKLNGQAPFNVFLGNAPQVRIEVNNKIVEFDHLISSNTNVANITISAQSEVARTSNR